MDILLAANIQQTTSFLMEIITSHLTGRKKNVFLEKENMKLMIEKLYIILNFLCCNFWFWIKIPWHAIKREAEWIKKTFVCEQDMNGILTKYAWKIIYAVNFCPLNILFNQKWHFSWNKYYQWDHPSKNIKTYDPR